jgi:hypothetical protein
MFEQIQETVLNATKQYADVVVKANTLAVDSFEKLVELQLKSIEHRTNAVADLFETAIAVKGLEDVRALMPKSVAMVKDQAEKHVALSQDSAAIFGKSGEAFYGLFKSQFESANDVVLKASKVVSKK